MFTKQDERAVQALRMLSVQQVEKANSGHPGLPLGAAPMLYTLFTKVMKHNPKNSAWKDRDRFVLSAGHGSALLYSMLHLSGYDLTMEDLKNFRQLGSRTPGHPEVKHTDGVEATTGPLGQGIATAVGMAMAEAHLAAIYNTAEHALVDHYTYALCGDGDLMEGVSAEAASLAGHLQLGKLIVLYDSNDICLDGATSMSFTESVGLRFKSYGWQVLHVPDGNDMEAIRGAIEAAKEKTDAPTLIEIKTTIGYGAPKAGTNAVHGAPLGAEGVAALRKALQWEYEDFTVPQEVYDLFATQVVERGEKEQAVWEENWRRYQEAYPEKAKAWNEAWGGKIENVDALQLPVWSAEEKPMASRKSSEACIQALAKSVPNLWGGSADLSSSNNTRMKDETDFSPENYAGRNINFGVREFAMGAMMNGIALHGGSRVYGATFFVFSDYLKPAIRLAALSRIPVTYVFTHDSVAVGEDGPTHEPIEQLPAWRAMPNLDVLRPADGNETAAAWACAVQSEDHPTMLVLSRQNLPFLEGTQEKAMAGVQKGAYVLSDAENFEGILLATGSEVALALEAQKQLRDKGIAVRVVSMPSQYRFEKQDADYRESVLPSDCTRRVSVEAASTYGWHRYLGFEGVALGIDRFGASGPGNEVLKQFKMTAEDVVRAFEEGLQR